MKEILNNITDFIIIVNRDGIIKYSNNIFLKKIGYVEGEIYNKNILDIISGVNDFMSIISDTEKNLKFSTKNNETFNTKGKVISARWNEEDCYCIIIKEVYSRALNENITNILDNLPYYAWGKDVNGKYTYINKTYRNKYDIIDNYLEDYNDNNFWDKDYLETVKDMDTKVLLTGESIISEEAATYKGEKQIFEVFRKPIFNEDGKVTQIIGTARDISVESKFKDELEKQHKKITTISNIEEMSYDKDSLVNLMKNLKEDMIDKLCVDGVSIHIYDKQTESLNIVLRIKECLYEDYGYESIKVDYDTFAKAIREKKFIGCLNEVYSADYIHGKQKLIDRGIKYVGHYPITFNNEIVGLINLVYKDTNNVVGEDVHIIKIICNKIGTLVGINNLISDLNIELNKRKDIENELESFLKTAADFIGILDGDGVIRKVELGWRVNVGWKNNELVERMWTDFVDEEDVRNILSHNYDENRGEFIKNKSRFRCKDGTYRLFDWRGVYLKERKIFIVTARDITKEQELEDERKRYEEAFQMESLKSEFFSNMSHEFKTPLNILLSVIQLIDYGIRNNTIEIRSEMNVSKYMKTIKQNSYRLLRMVNNIIDMTRIDTGFFNIQPANFNIVSVVEDIVTSVVEYVEGVDINITFDTEVEELIIACDPDKIERIVLNLISNAIKYSGDNGRIDIFIKVRDKVYISVEDNGIGIDEEELSRIFDRFRRVNSSFSRKVEGSGIGLSLVRSLVHMHGGDIVVESEKDKGTKFTFSLPIKKVENEEEVIMNDTNLHSKVDVCNIEFADIYDI